MNSLFHSSVVLVVFSLLCGLESQIVSAQQSSGRVHHVQLDSNPSRLSSHESGRRVNRSGQDSPTMVAESRPPMPGHSSAYVNTEPPIQTPPPIIKDPNVRLSTSHMDLRIENEVTSQTSKDGSLPALRRLIDGMDVTSPKGEAKVPSYDRAPVWLEDAPLENPDESPVTTNEADSMGKKTTDQSKLKELISKIASNTVLVLVIGIGIIVVAKAMGPKQKVQTTKTDDFNVLSQLQLPSKSQLMLVDVEGRRLVVALDATGVKAVIPFQESDDAKQSFTDTLAMVAESMPAASPSPVLNEPVQRAAPQKAQAPAKASKPAATQVDEPSSESGYSLRSIGRRLETRGEEEAREREEQSMHDALEAAMSESGLKELILKSIRNA